MIRYAAFLCLAFASQAISQELDLSGGGTAIRVDISPAMGVRLPTTAWTPGTTITETEGAVRRTVYQLPNTARTSLQLIAPARSALEDDGYSIIFACADAACGGFDFRFQLDLLPEPDMHVDLGNYRYLLMQNEGASPHTVSLVASVSASAGFLHVTEVSDAILPEATATIRAPNTGSTPAPAGDLIEELKGSGHTVLNDLEFRTGSTDLGDGPYPSLSVLAAWLGANPTARVVLVGHTDAVGSLDANTSLSQRRAAAVVERLVANFATNREQLQAAGAGYLSPVASNLSPEGRASNRRVEVVLLSVE